MRHIKIGGSLRRQDGTEEYSLTFLLPDGATNLLEEQVGLKFQAGKLGETLQENEISEEEKTRRAQRLAMRQLVDVPVCPLKGAP